MKLSEFSKLSKDYIAEMPVKLGNKKREIPFKRKKPSKNLATLISCLTYPVLHQKETHITYSYNKESKISYIMSIFSGFQYL